MLTKWSESLHARMEANGVAAPSVPVILYTFRILANTFGITLLSLLIGWVTGAFADTLIVLAVLALIRFLSGGYHLGSGVWCVVISTVIVAAIPHVPVGPVMLWVLTGAAFVMMLIYAPANYDKYARIDPKYFPVMKISASLVVLLNVVFQSELLAVIYMLQALSLPFKEGESSE